MAEPKKHPQEDENLALYKEESGIRTEADFSYKNSKKVMGLWPEGRIYYKFKNFQKSGSVLTLVQKAIEMWNSTNGPHCEFVNNETYNNQYYVTFEKVSTGYPCAEVGCSFDQSQTIKLPEKYPSGTKVKISCILHEMMHCAGFIHEHCCQDRDFHCFVTKNADPNLTKTGVSIGHHDYYSIMRYGEIPDQFMLMNKELKMLTDESLIFSAGDRAAIKLAYSKKGTHYGDWHDPCDPSKCSDVECKCNNCKKLETNLSCGYVGNKGHWTCCLDENKYSRCETTHTGFRHAACIDEKCTPEKCWCQNCGSGCTYKGMKAHWSCCNEEELKGECKKDFKKIPSDIKNV